MEYDGQKAFGAILKLQTFLMIASLADVIYSYFQYMEVLQLLVFTFYSFYIILWTTFIRSKAILKGTSNKETASAHLFINLSVGTFFKHILLHACDLVLTLRSCVCLQACGYGSIMRS